MYHAQAQQAQLDLHQYGVSQQPQPQLQQIARATPTQLLHNGSYVRGIHPIAELHHTAASAAALDRTPALSALPAAAMRVPGLTRAAHPAHIIAQVSARAVTQHACSQSRLTGGGGELPYYCYANRVESTADCDHRSE